MWNFQIKKYLVPKGFVCAGSDEMLHSVIFHLGIHCLPEYLLTIFILHAGTLANSEDPDEMLHKVAFYQDLQYLLRSNQW